MGELIATTLIVFVSTSIDDLILLIIFQNQAQNRTERLAILGGQFLGIGTLVILSVIGTYFAKAMLENWIIGLLGFIPLFLGIRALMQKTEATEVSTNAGRTLFLTVTSVTIASGGDNIGIYIPWFSSQGWQALPMVLCIFSLMIALFCVLSYLLANQSQLKVLISRYSAILVPIVFMLLGFSILSEMGTLSYVYNLL